jgi:hypothetical protein
MRAHATDSSGREGRGGGCGRHSPMPAQGPGMAVVEPWQQLPALTRTSVALQRCWSRHACR